MVPVLSSLAVGCIFLFAGILKLVSPSGFVRHLSALLIKSAPAAPGPILIISTGLLAAAECILGVAAALRIFPAAILPLCLLFIASLAAIAVWGAVSRRTDDCGCFGNLIVLRPGVSALLSILYAALITIAWRMPTAYALSPSSQRNAFSGSLAFFSGAAIFSFWSYAKFGQDLVNTSPVRPRRRWKPSWLAHYGVHATEQTQLIVLMSAGCSVCKKWISPLNKISRREDMPQVIGAMAAGPQEISDFVSEWGAAYPVLSVRPHTMSRLANAFPTIVLLEAGRIASVQVGRLPAELLDRLGNAVPETEFAAR